MLIPGKTACKEGNGILSDVDDDDLRFEDARQSGGDHTGWKILGIKSSGWNSLDIRSEGSITESG